MKKISLTKSILAAGFLSAAASSNAAMGDLKFYAGAGLDYNTYSLTSEAKQDMADANQTLKTNGLGLQVPILGIKFHENFGIEAAYTMNKKFSMTEPGEAADAPAITTKNKVSNMYLDLVGFMPVVDQMELIGGLGIGRLKAKLSDDESLSKTSWRAKIGAQYNFNSNFAARVTAAYQNIGKKFGVKNMKTIGLSMFYTF